MAILQKEALEYQRALFELPKFFFTGITIFSTAASFLVKDKIGEVQNYFYGVFFLVGMLLTLVAFIFAFSVVAHTVQAMRLANTNEEAEKQVDGIINGVYRRMSYSGIISIIYWLFFIVGLVLY